MNRARAPGLLAALVATAVLGCATGSRVGTSRAFVDGEKLAAMERGVSTRRDVQRALGAPDGSGHALLPTDPTPLDLWYYEDIEVADVEQTARGDFRAHARQQILLVMFRGDAFDGFMWWSNAGSLKK